MGLILAEAEGGEEKVSNSARVRYISARTEPLGLGSILKPPPAATGWRTSRRESMQHNFFSRKVENE